MIPEKILKSAFTLVELLVVIAIIGILSGLIIVGMNSSVNSARIAKAQIFSATMRDSMLSSIISEWKFDGTGIADGSAVTTVYTQDTWGSNSLAIPGNAPLVYSGTNCVFGSCLKFNGTSDYLQVPGSDASTSNLAITGAISISTWVKFNTVSTDNAIITRGVNGNPGAGNLGYNLWRYSYNNLIIYQSFDTAGNRDELNSIKVMNDNNWHLITTTWDGTTNTNGKKIYIDGILDNQRTSAISSVGQPAYFFRIGVMGGGSFYMNGYIDEVRIYNAAIPSSLIKQNYYAGVNRLLAKDIIKRGEYINNIIEINE